MPPISCIAFLISVSKDGVSVGALLAALGFSVYLNLTKAPPSLILGGSERTSLSPKELLTLALYSLP